ncbi:MAG: response regulator transcription factor [Bacteroidia bacterium]
MSKANILLVEDDENLGIVLKEYLEMKDYSVRLCRDGDEGLARYEDGKFDLLILDVMLPRKDGFTLARDIHARNPNHPPIIFLTAKSEKEDRLTGFKVGADDYLTKPFSMEELLYRVNAILRRTGNLPNQNGLSGEMKFGDFIFDPDHQTLKCGPESRKLSTKESELLRMLCLHQNNVLSRDVALKEIWNEHDYFTARSMDVYITKLRKYLKQDPRVQIMNVHGKGYRLLVEQ